MILLGNSGGGSLFAYYQAQAATPPPHRVSETTLVVAYSGDNAVFMGEAEAQYKASPAPDKTFTVIKGADHYGMPLPGVTRDTRAELFRLLGDWLRERFPSA